MQDNDKKTDTELVKLTLENDDFYYYLVKRYEKKLLHYILKISDFDFATAEDILQEVFINIYKNLNDFDETLSFSSWIYRSTHNLVVTYFRKNLAKAKKMIKWNSDDDLMALIPSEIDLPAEIGKKELAEKVKISLKNLPEKYREVLVLRFLEDKSYLEISDILRKPINSVSVLISRAKAILKDKLSDFNR